MSILHKVSRIFRSDADEEPSPALRSDEHAIGDTQPQDVFIAGYPKSGNTWMQQLISGVIYGIDTRHLPDRLSQELVPDVHMNDVYRRYRDVCTFKTHALPKARYRRVVHLVRDGRDVMASYFAMNQNLGKEVTLREMIEEGKGVYPCEWHNHCATWTANPHDAELIRVCYEDLHDRPVETLKTLCDFLDIERDEELLQRVIDGCSFKQMKKKEQEYGWKNEDWPEDADFIRKGKVGGYKDEIPPDLVRSFEEKAGTMLAKMGYALQK